MGKSATGNTCQYGIHIISSSRIKRFIISTNLSPEEGKRSLMMMFSNYLLEKEIKLAYSCLLSLSCSEVWPPHGNVNRVESRLLQISQYCWNQTIVFPDCHVLPNNMHSYFCMFYCYESSRSNCWYLLGRGHSQRCTAVLSYCFTLHFSDNMSCGTSFMPMCKLHTFFGEMSVKVFGSCLTGMFLYCWVVRISF